MNVMTRENWSYGELALFDHKKQVKEFGWCACEEQEYFPYDNCPKVSLQIVFNADLQLALKHSIMELSINGGKMDIKTNINYLRIGLDVALELLTDEQLEEWNKVMEEE